MLAPGRSVTPPEPDGPPASEHGSNDGDPPATRTARDPRRIVLVLGLLAALAALAFPFAPVVHPDVRYSWTAADGPAAIPLMPYQPVELTARIDCATARDAVGGGGTLLSTVPPRPDVDAWPLSGLRISAAGGELRIASAGVELGTVAVPGGDCTVVVAADPRSTTVLVDGAPVLTRDGDVRPDVAGAFTDVPSGVELTLTADTRFQTTISPFKAALGAGCALALLGMLVALGRADRVARPAVRLLPRRWWRPRPVDGAVAVLLGLWWVIGPITVDDGYIAGIVRSRASNGLVGNVYRWLNAPEAPFSWFYELYHLWSLASSSTLWMRLPSTLLGLLCWWLLSRLALPRLGRFAASRATPWLAALAFAIWWLPFNLGLRPEPWVAVGGLAVFLAVERAVATRRVLPLAVGLVLAGATTAVTPNGLMAFTPFLAAALPVLRILRARRDLHVLPLLAALVAAPASAVLLMVPDQSLAAMLEATRVRALIGGGLPWHQEYARYATLLAPADFQGAIGRRAAVLCTLLAAAGLLWSLRRRRIERTLRRASCGIAVGPAGRLVLGLLLSLAAMTLSPTKWTQHFGDVAGIGAAVVVLGLVAFGTAPLRDRARARVTGLGAVIAVGALVLAGYNIWPYAAGWFGPTFSTMPPTVAGVTIATIALVGGTAVVLGLAGRAAWARAGGATESALPRWVPAPASIVAVLLVGVLTLQVGGFLLTAVRHRDSYTLAADSLATLGGDPCGLAPLLSVETDPAAGLLPSRPGPTTRAVRPVDVGGRTLPGIAVAGTFATAWYDIDPAQRDGTVPVVVTTSGLTRVGDLLTVEFAAGDELLSSRRIAVGSATPSDVREMAPAGADAVRLVVDAPTGGTRSPALVSLPRVPRLTPMRDVLPPGRTAILDWPVAFLFPCLTPEPLRLGSASLAEWRVGPPAADPAAGITYAPAFGGPFAAPRLLVTEQRMATYLRGDPTRDAAQLYRWVPIAALARPDPVVADRGVAGWHADGHARVPGLDPVG